MTAPSTRVPLRHAFMLLGALAVVTSVTRAVSGRELRPTVRMTAAGDVTRVPAEDLPTLALGDSLFGRSGALRARLLAPEAALALAPLVRQFGETALRGPGVLTVQDGQRGAAPFAFITLRPWGQKRGAYVGGYHVGWWPGERRAAPQGYALPAGFIEVTQANRDTRLSSHFRLRDFVTHDQHNVWPKYVVLREALLDKLELVLAEMAQGGVPARHVVVLSGFRSPQYNTRGAGEGMAPASRHQYGDAADVIIDDDRDGRMDDLNRDGRVDYADTDVIERAVERVERRYPDLVGGLGLYHATGPSGPFAHIDVRGSRARWSNAPSIAARPRAGSYASLSSGASFSGSRPSGTGAAERVSGAGGCSATGRAAILCAAMQR